MLQYSSYLFKCTDENEYFSIAVYPNVFSACVTWTCACIKAKFSSDGSHWAQCLSAAQVPLSVSARQLCLTSISKHKQSCQSQKLQQCFQIRYHCCHEKQNPDRLFMTYLPSWPHVCQEITKKQKTKPTRTMRTGFLLWLFTSVLLKFAAFLIVFSSYTLRTQQTDSGKNEVKCVSTTLLDPRRGSWTPVLSARPSLLSPHLQ